MREVLAGQGLDAEQRRRGGVLDINDPQSGEPVGYVEPVALDIDVPRDTGGGHVVYAQEPDIGRVGDVEQEDPAEVLVAGVGEIGDVALDRAGRGVADRESVIHLVERVRLRDPVRVGDVVDAQARLPVALKQQIAGHVHAYRVVIGGQTVDLDDVRRVGYVQYADAGIQAGHKRDLGIAAAARGLDDVDVPRLALGRELAHLLGIGRVRYVEDLQSLGVVGHVQQITKLVAGQHLAVRARGSASQDGRVVAVLDEDLDDLVDEAVPRVEALFTGRDDHAEHGGRVARRGEGDLVGVLVDSGQDVRVIGLDPDRQRGRAVVGYHGCKADGLTRRDELGRDILDNRPAPGRGDSERPGHRLAVGVTGLGERDLHLELGDRGVDGHVDGDLERAWVHADVGAGDQVGNTDARVHGAHVRVGRSDAGGFARRHVDPFLGKLGPGGDREDLGGPVAVAVVQSDRDVPRPQESLIRGDGDGCVLGVVGWIDDLDVLQQRRVDDLPVGPGRGHLAEGVEDVPARDDLPEDEMDPVEVMGGPLGDEELAVVRIQRGEVGHSQHARARVAQAGVYVRPDGVAEVIQRAPAAAVAVGGVAGLDHEAVYDPVDVDVGVVRLARRVEVPVRVHLVRGQRYEARGRLRGAALEELHEYVAENLGAAAVDEVEARVRVVLADVDMEAGQVADGRYGQPVAVGVKAVYAQGQRPAAGIDQVGISRRVQELRRRAVQQEPALQRLEGRSG